MTRLTRNQTAVLAKLSQAQEGLFGRDFADIATVTHGRWEWSQPILRALAERGFAEQVGPKTHKGIAWEITEAGRSAIATAAPHTPGKPGPLSNAMRNEVIIVGRAQATGHPEERCGMRVTHEALAARGLVVIEELDRGWRRLRLTGAGVASFEEITGEKLTIPEEVADEDPEP